MSKEEKILEFLKNNPTPSKDRVIEWAKKNDIDIDEVNEIMYTLATKFMYFWLGGESNKKGITKKDVDKKQLKRGIEVEYEHTLDRGDISTEISERIALDHLAESYKWKNPKYYDGLDEMEESYSKGTPIKKASISDSLRLLSGYIKKKKKTDIGDEEITLWYTKTPQGLKMVDQKSTV